MSVLTRFWNEDGGFGDRRQNVQRILDASMLIGKVASPNHAVDFVRLLHQTPRGFLVTM